MSEAVQEISGRRPQQHRGRPRRNEMASNQKNEDKRKQVIGRLLEKAGLTLRDGQVVTICRTCGQEVVVKNEPLAESATR